jgi:hypothetical protein
MNKLPTTTALAFSLTGCALATGAQAALVRVAPLVRVAAESAREAQANAQSVAQPFADSAAIAGTLALCVAVAQLKRSAQNDDCGFCAERAIVKKRASQTATENAQRCARGCGWVEVELLPLRGAQFIEEGK